MGQFVESDRGPLESLVTEQSAHLGVEAVYLGAGRAQGVLACLAQLQHHGTVLVRMRLLGDQACFDEPCDEGGDGGLAQPQGVGESLLSDARLVMYGEQRPELGRGDTGGFQATTIGTRAQLVRCPLQEKEQALIGFGHGAILTDAHSTREPHFTSEVR